METWLMWIEPCFINQCVWLIDSWSVIYVILEFNCIVWEIADEEGAREGADPDFTWTNNAWGPKMIWAAEISNSKEINQRQHYLVHPSFFLSFLYQCNNPFWVARVAPSLATLSSICPFARWSVHHCSGHTNNLLLCGKLLAYVNSAKHTWGGMKTMTMVIPLLP